MKKIILILLLIFISFLSFSQNIGKELEKELKEDWGIILDIRIIKDILYFYNSFDGCLKEMIYNFVYFLEVFKNYYKIKIFKNINTYIYSWICTLTSQNWFLEISVNWLAEYYSFKSYNNKYKMIEKLLEKNYNYYREYLKNNYNQNYR